MSCWVNLASLYKCFFYLTLMHNLWIFCLPVVTAHVSLTFPPARYPPLDFLDVYRTAEPCGVPKTPKSPITTLEAGQSYNITWHLGYAHQGGIQLSLLDSSENEISRLTPVEPVFVKDDDQTAQHFQVILPQKECRGCSIKLLREAREWGQYQFWSCADVDILQNPQNSVNKQCSGHGQLQDGKCNCSPGYHGEYCQNKNDCENDADCGTHGSCVELKSTSYPLKVCYCSAPNYGQYCDKAFQPSTEDVNSGCFNYLQDNNRPLFNMGCYQKNEISEGDMLFWRMIKCDEIEIVIDFTGESWIGMGWRPLGTSTECYNFPVSVTKKAESLHPMDCTDMIIGSAIGTKSHIFDGYTRDRSTPWRDEIYGGLDSLIAAIGRRETNRTMIMIRRKIASTDKADYSLIAEEMHVIWAKGMIYPEYNFPALSGLEIGGASDKKFYKPDELKYHGVKNRGSLKINFLQAAPSNCNFPKSPSHSTQTNPSISSHAEPEPGPGSGHSLAEPTSASEHEPHSEPEHGHAPQGFLPGQPAIVTQYKAENTEKNNTNSASFVKLLKLLLAFLLCLSM